MGRDNQCAVDELRAQLDRSGKSGHESCESPANTIARFNNATENPAVLKRCAAHSPAAPGPMMATSNSCKLSTSLNCHGCAHCCDWESAARAARVHINRSNHSIARAINSGARVDLKQNMRRGWATAVIALAMMSGSARSRSPPSAPTVQSSIISTKRRRIAPPQFDPVGPQRRRADRHWHHELHAATLPQPVRFSRPSTSRTFALAGVTITPNITW